jgi:outer membrane protein, heavy metal efflux system
MRPLRIRTAADSLRPCRWQRTTTLAARLSFLLAVALLHQRTLVAAETQQEMSAKSTVEATAQARLSLEALQELARENNPTLNQAAAAVDMARGIQRQATLYPNPQLGYLRTDGDTSNATRTTGAFFGQEIVTGKKIEKARNTEGWEVERGNWNYQAQTMRVMNDVQLRHYDVLGAQESLKISDKLLRTAQLNLSVTEKLFSGKQVPKGDVLQARIQLKTVVIAQRESQARLDAAWNQLLNVVGCPELAWAPMSGELVGEIPVLDWESSWAELVARSPLLKAAEARAHHFQNQYRLEQANAIPNVNLQVVAERDHVQQFSTVSTLVSMPIPVINRNQGNIFRAAAETREAVSEIKRTQLALRDQLAESFRRYQSARAQVEELQRDILPDAEENLRLSIEAYRASEVGYLTVLTAQRTSMETNLAYIDAWTELRKVTTEIDGLLLTGGLNPAELGTALQSQPGSNQRRAVLNQMQEGQGGGTLPAALQK